MKIEVSTDSRVESKADDIAKVTEVVEAGLARFKERLTRVEVHLSDINGHRGGVDRRCLLETRPAGLQPVAVENVAATELEAVRGALDKMKRMLTSALER